MDRYGMCRPGMVFVPIWSGKGDTFFLKSLEKGSVFTKTPWTIKVFLNFFGDLCR